MRARGLTLARARTADSLSAAALVFDSAAGILRQRRWWAKHAVLVMYQGAVQNDLGRPDLAFPLADSALRLLRRTGDRPNEPAALVVLAQAQQLRGQSRDALASLRAGRTILGALLGDLRDAESRRGLQLLEGRLLSDLGNTFTELGDPDSAGFYLARADTARRALGDTLGQAITLVNFGRLQQTLGRPDSATVLFARALIVQRARGDQVGEAQTLNNIGYSFDLKGDPRSALVRQREAWTLLRRSGHRSLEGVTLVNMGRNHLALHDLAAAADDVTTALKLERAIGNEAVAGWALHDLGRIALARGDVPAAITALAESRRILAAGGDQVRAASAAYYLGRARSTPGPRRDLRSAIDDFAAAHEARLAVGGRVGADADRVAFAEQDLRLTEDWVLAWLGRDDMGASDVALASMAVMERGRARALLRLIRGTPDTSIPDRDPVREGRGIAAIVGGTGAAVGLSYLLTDAELLIWVTRADGATSVIRQPSTRDEIGRLVSQLRAAYGIRTGCEPRQSRPDADPIATRLSAILFPSGVRALLPDSGEIVIVPQGPLNLLPFAALPIGAADVPLGIRFALRYAPSLEVLRARVGGDLRLHALQSRALVVGNPAMPWVTMCGSRAFRPSPLRGADSSSRAVARLLGAPLLSGADASERTVMALLPEASIVNLETHGYAFETESRSRETFIALAPGDTTLQQLAPGDDGRLTVGEIMDGVPRMSAELVVLSACQTAMGDLKDAEGTIGLQRAFLSKGARSVLVSLWNVNDQATARLVETFYTTWLAAPRVSKAEALRQAQQFVYEHVSRNPYYWAAFQLAGER